MLPVAVESITPVSVKTRGRAETTVLCTDELLADAHTSLMFEHVRSVVRVAVLAATRKTPLLCGNIGAPIIECTLGTEM